MVVYFFLLYFLANFHIKLGRALIAEWSNAFHIYFLCIHTEIDWTYNFITRISFVDEKPFSSKLAYNILKAKLDFKSPTFTFIRLSSFAYLYSLFFYSTNVRRFVQMCCFYPFIVILFPSYLLDRSNHRTYELQEDELLNLIFLLRDRRGDSWYFFPLPHISFNPPQGWSDVLWSRDFVSKDWVNRKPSEDV